MIDYSKVSIRDVNDILSAAKAFRDIALELGGFQVAACDNIASKYPMEDADGEVLASSVFGWPETTNTWWKRPIVALNSPLPRACRYESEAFWVNQEKFFPRQPNRFLDEINLAKFREFVGSNAVICVPIHLPFGQLGAVSFSPTDPETSNLSEQFEKYGYILEDVSRRFISGYVKAMHQRVWIPVNCKLSKREIECLRWASIGKTDKEIAFLLSRSCATVRFHLHNAAVKLDAVNRCQTVFKASQLGFLGSAA
jgi:DNA-binding CsgD family transcriptional regulator